jgi:L-tyrosine isonitrile synthase
MRSDVYLNADPETSKSDQTSFNPAEVLKSFNTWAFKREHPTELPLLRNTIAAMVEKAAPLQFVLYWGKGPRAACAEPEQQCLDFLALMLERIETAYPPGARVTLIQTDTHALHNGHSPASIQSYFSDVAEAAAERGFATFLLSQAVEMAKVDSKVCDALPPEDMLAKLEKCAAKWYQGDGSVEIGAKRYYSLNMIEKRSVELKFPGSIFITFNGREYRDLFPPNLPVFYMYSMRKGISVKPWFVHDRAESHTRLKPGCIAQQPGDGVLR